MLRKSFAQVVCLFRKSETTTSKTILSYLSTKPEQNDMRTALGQTWDDSLRKLQDLGFTVKQSGKMLLHNPALTICSSEKLSYHFEVLGSFGFKTEEIKEILVQEPKIFNTESRVLKRNHSNLLTQIGDHQGRIAALQAPNLLVDNPLVTNQKIDYCIMEMYLSKPIIAKSKILQCPFSLIKTRHTFAYRSGLYKKIDPKNKEGLANNPSIRDLFLCSDEDFLTRFKGFTLEEYAVFEAMVSEEDQINEDEQMDGNIDDDSAEDDGNPGHYNKRGPAKKGSSTRDK